VVRILLSIGGNSLGAELLEYFGYKADSATSSAFIQQRGKIKSSAIESLFHEFTGSLRMHKTFDGYRLLAFDGTDLNITHNPGDIQTYFQSAPATCKFIPSTTTFDYLDLQKNLFYPMSFRVVRIKLSDTVYETLITNLARDDFGVKKLKIPYHLRWGIETSFSSLRYFATRVC